jgi:protein gp37
VPETRAAGQFSGGEPLHDRRALGVAVAPSDGFEYNLERTVSDPSLGHTMSDGSTIEWTDATWNPVRGCKKVSPGCKHCYAETFAERWRGVPGHPYEQGFDLRIVEEHLLDPLKWPTPRKIFVNSMSDLFQEGVSTSYIRAVFEVMRVADWHTYQVLTKRAGRMRRVVNALPAELKGLSHVWLGVSVEDKKYGVPRIDDLRGTHAGLRFLSIEPLLEDLGKLDLRDVDWVIVGGESGPGARPMRAEWAVSLREQCRRGRVPFFFKQWGGLNKKRAGRMLDGEIHDGFPVQAAREAPTRARRLEMVRGLRDLAEAAAE